MKGETMEKSKSEKVIEFFKKGNFTDLLKLIRWLEWGASKEERWALYEMVEKAQDWYDNKGGKNWDLKKFK